MKQFLIILLSVFTIGLSAQNYKTHKVKTGETIESIAKTYLVTPFDILALNPDAKTSFGPNTTLIIPNSKVKNDPIVEESKEVIDYKKHKVKRKETLYGLSKKYNVSEDEIKKANPRLYSENLRRGDRIRIPRFKIVVSKQTLSNTIKKYTVLPSEGKWRIAYKFGITVQELEDLNPDIKEVIQPGDELNVPNIANNEEKATDTEYNYYEVLPKEGFYRLKVKLGLTQEELEELNPGLAESGLKMGMVLKVPSDVEVSTTITGKDYNVTDLRDNITNTSTKRLAVLLPFKLHRIDLDSVAEVKAMMKSDRILSTALDFHSGVLMALDSAKNLGISTNLKVFDTENRTTEIANITSNEDFSNYDAVIGPMMSKTFDRFAIEVRSDAVPVFAPLAMPSKVSRNVYQTIPNKKILSQKMVNYIKQDSTKTQVVIIADQKHKTISNNLKREFPAAKQLFSELTKKGKDKGKDAYFIYPTTFEGLFKKGKNIVFLETDDMSFGSSIISLLNGLSVDDIEIVLTTTNKSRAFESKDPDNNYHLSNLKFHYATINKQYDTDTANGFVSMYKSRYGLTPSKYATRGFDLTLDILLRLASNDDGLPNSGDELATEYIENKFRYTKKTFGGYVNEATYIVRYDNLKIVVVN
ncbi:MAG: LysM peptidoglycan-binding domain-containing protein [Winogradskyella sp.]|nr:MAG: LysM peptidoglycan-binding domain-containing protein [Winogradskyella sp.]